MKNGRSFTLEAMHRDSFSETLKVPDSLPDPPLLPKPARCKLIPDYKLPIFQEAEACHDHGAIGARSYYREYKILLELIRDPGDAYMMVISRSDMAKSSIDRCE